MYHCKIERDEIGRQVPEQIITARDFRLGLNLKDELTGVTIAIRKLEADLPHKVLFGTLIYEIDK